MTSEDVSRAAWEEAARPAGDVLAGTGLGVGAVGGKFGQWRMGGLAVLGRAAKNRPALYLKCLRTSSGSELRPQ